MAAIPEQTASLPSFETQMNFSGPVAGRARVDAPNWANTNMALKPYDLRIYDARPIADALSQARLVTISNGDTGAPETTTNNITSVIQTVLAAQLVSRGLVDVSPSPSISLAPSTTPTAAEAKLPSSIPGSSVKK